MTKNSIPQKVAIGYAIATTVLVLALWLVYSNTQTLMAINKATQNYTAQREKADSLMRNLLTEEQANLSQLAEAMGTGDAHERYLHQKVNNLSTGKDSVLVHAPAPQTHEAKQTTVEVVKTRKGFFHRLADTFKKERTDTIRVTQDSGKTTIDTIATPIDVAGQVAKALKQINQEEKKANKQKAKEVNKEMDELKLVSTQLALRANQQMNNLRLRERASIQQALDKAIQARRGLLWQIGMLAIVAIVAAVGLLWHIWRDNQKAFIYQENLRRAQEETQRIMEQRERLLLTITHDIKAPAASISGFIDLLKKAPTGPQTTQYLDNMKAAATHLSALVAMLLDYHQLENGLLEIHPVAVHPLHLINQCAEAMRPKAEAKGLSIHVDTPTRQDAPSHMSTNAEGTYMADAFRIRQILDNLVSNAVKYTDHGSITIQARIQNRNSLHSLLVVSVKDTGKGMTQEECQRIFDAFARLKDAQGIEGVGLGLSITHELVQLLGGEIKVESKKGTGSTFTVLLPIDKTNNKTEPTEVEQPQVATPTPIYHNQRIVILDDDPLQLQLLQAMLQQIAPAWQVYACHHVAESLTQLHDKQPALMLIDIEMPEMSGIDLIQHINHHNMVIVAMTAHDASILPKLKEAGFDDCLFKPIEQESLSRLIGTSENSKCHQEKSEADTTETPTSQAKGLRERAKALLSFAGGDAEAEEEILKSTQSELENYCRGIRKELGGSLNLKAIGKMGHKLLPIASMLQMRSLEAIKSLSPERIQELDADNTRRLLREILKELQEILGKSYVQRL